MAEAVGPPLPILWSFRRCPYAIRARLALAAAGVAVQLREVNLRAKPPELLAVSPQATVPVLEPSDGPVLSQSLEIMEWALGQSDPGDWLRRRQDGPGAVRAQRLMATLIAANDGPFKHHLDRFKYGDAHSPGSRREHGEAAYAILRRWNRLLERPLPLAAGAPPALDQEGPWLLGQHSSLADWALLPFVRQLRLADPETFAAAPGLDGLRAWLARFEGGGALATVMVPPLAHRQPWRSPSWIYHLALAQEWRESEQDGVYRRSTRGLSLDQVGFIHASDAHQIAATFGRFYVDAGPVLLLSIDPQRLRAAGITIAWQPDPASGELFPHILGALPCPAVVVTEPYQP